MINGLFHKNSVDYKQDIEARFYPGFSGANMIKLQNGDILLFHSPEL